MIVPEPNIAEQVARVASALHEERTGHAPTSVSVVLDKETLVITLQGALTPAETAVATNAAGAAQVKEYHRQLFAASQESLRLEIKRITGVDVRGTAAQIEPTAGAVVEVFPSGTMVQVFLLAKCVPSNSSYGNRI